GVRLGARGGERLGRCPAPSGLRRLRGEMPPPARTAAAALARSANLGGLKVLELPDGCGDAHLQALLDASLLGNLSALRIAFSTLTRKGISALVRSGHAPRLRRLEFRHTLPAAA